MLAAGVTAVAAVAPLPHAVVADPRPETGDARSTAPSRIALTVVVTPPAYLGGAAVEFPDATAVDIVAGSDVTLRAGTTARALTVSRAGAPTLAAPARDGLAVIELPSPSDGAWLVTQDGSEEGARLLIVRVVADAAPTVRVVEPGRDRRSRSAGGRSRDHPRGA